MGRAENRRQVKNLKSKSLSVQAREHQRMRQELQLQATYSATVDSLEVFVAASVVALHDKFGFGEKRLQKFIHEASEQMECIFADTIKRREMLELARELSKCPLNWREVMEDQCLVPKENAPVGVGAPNESKQVNVQ